MRNTLLAKRYLDALKNSLPQEVIVSSFEQLDGIIADILNHNELWPLLRGPLLQNNIKEEIVINILEKSQTKQEVINFFKILIQKNRINLLEDIKEILSFEIAELNNMVLAEITTPTPLNSENQETLLTYLKDITNKKIEPNFIHSEDSLGGFKAKIGNSILDGSIENSLNLLKQKFTSLN